MAKGPLITIGVEALIASVHQKHPKWKAPEVRNEVSYILHKDDPKIKRSFPSLSSVQKVLATVRKNESELKVDPQDKPWSMATLDQHPIPPEAIPAVLRVWKSRMQRKANSIIHEANQAAGYLVDQEELDSASKMSIMTSKADFTIREAKWAARFSSVIPVTLEEDMMVGIAVTKLEMLSSTYASVELVCRLIGRPFDSTALERLLMDLPPDFTNLLTYLTTLVRPDGTTITMEQLKHHWPEKEAKKKEVNQNERTHRKEG